MSRGTRDLDWDFTGMEGFGKIGLDFNGMYRSKWGLSIKIQSNLPKSP